MLEVPWEPSNTEGPPKLKTIPNTETLGVGWILRDCLIQILSFKTETRKVK